MTAATELDHIKPKTQGGTDEPANLQPLCSAHHRAKTLLESGGGRGRPSPLFYPRDLKPSAIPLTIVCGPPAAGKTSYVAERAKPKDIIIDIDKLAGTREALSRDVLAEVLVRRNEMLAQLHAMVPDGKSAWFIVGAPKAEEREAWSRQLAPREVVVLKPSKSACLRRIETDDARPGLSKVNLSRAVRSWFSRYTPRAADTVLVTH